MTGATSSTFHDADDGSVIRTYSATDARSYTNPNGTGTAWVVAHRAFPSPATVTWSSTASNAWEYEDTKALLLPVESTCTAV